MTRASLLLVGLVLWRCDSSVPVYPFPDGGSSGAGGGAAMRQTQCSAVACKPPTCCGQACGAGCCRGTICSTTGVCIPDECSACPSGRCTYNASTCTATCTPPACCLGTCSLDGDCCMGTRCLDSQDGTRRCYPTTCAACGGMRPTCSTSQLSCESTCVAPSTCGRACTGPTECGSGSECHTFLDGSKHCVPNAFQSLCNACGGLGCRLLIATCDIECQRPDAGTPPPFDAGTPPPFDAGSPPLVDAGRAQPVDAGPPPPPCLACCSRCAPDAGPQDATCCPGSYCGAAVDGGFFCFPSLCRSSCDDGCSFTCPG